MIVQIAVFVGIVLGLLGFLVAGVAAGLVVAVLTGALSAFAVARTADRIALRLVHAEPADPVRHARLLNLVDGLRVAGGVPMPDVRVVDDPAPNACSFGRDPQHAVVVVTEGLLDRLTRIELEGVLAHEISHVKTLDIRPATYAVAVWGVLGLVVPALGERARRAAGPNREPLADLAGVRLTRYPPGLIAALEKLEAAPAGVSTASRATSSLWIRTAAAPALQARIETLREL